MKVIINYTRIILEKKNYLITKTGIDLEYLYGIKNTRKALKVKAGSLVLWDSRCFHQNQYGNFKSFKPEERIVQYICYLPKNHKKKYQSYAKKKD